ncbi:MAG: hypothetical protein MUP15_02680, partial [Dehalococcoidia bacterium]|nr:hypothetical protein [Dehalococcoidia bacterium]
VIANSPVELTDDERGDTVFHAGLGKRPSVTRRYVDLLRNDLARLSPSGVQQSDFERVVSMDWVGLILGARCRRRKSGWGRRSRCFLCR